VSTAYDYDSTGLLWHQYAPSPAGTTTYGYDAQGHLTSQTDADGNTTFWAYDVLGNKATETDPDTVGGPTISYAYDAAERLCRRVAANPGVVLQSLTNPCSDAVSGAIVDTRYGRDAAGNVTTLTDALGNRTIASTYDPLNRALTISGDASGDPSTTYSYDFSSPTRTDPSGSYTATLDAYGRETSLTDPLHSSGNLFGWTYSPSGALATSSDPTGNTTSYTYDPLSRVTAKSTTGASGCADCAVYAFGYNNAGNNISKVSTISGDTTNGTTAYAYDPLSRLTGYTPPTATAQTYAWNGQPDRASVRVGTGTPVTTTFDAASRPTVDSAGNSYTSDKEGRITGLPGQTLVWDALGRLGQVKAVPSGTVLATYTYDALDRLRTIAESGVTTRFRYVGLTTAVAQIIDNASGAVISNHATDLSGLELYDFNPGGSVQAYLGRNSHSDVTWTSGSTGAVTSHAAYDPFGNLVSSSGSVPSTRWQGSYVDSVTGLYYVIARWYAPSLGTFLSDDPLTAAQADPQSRDPYAYGAGDSIDKMDPSGLCSYGGCEAGSASAYQLAQLRDLQRAQERYIKRVKSKLKYLHILDFIVGEIKQHAQGRSFNGSWMGPSTCLFCNNETTVNVILGAVTLAWNPVVGANAATLANFARLFRTNGRWDDKKVLSQRPNQYFRRPLGAVNYTLVPGEGDYALSYTVWGNIDFAFTARAWGMSRGFAEDGLTAAAWLGLGGGPSLASNRVARNTGYRLWDLVKGHPERLTSTILNNAIRWDYWNYRNTGAAILVDRPLRWNWDLD
jgi:RHS repeat-associated protein